MYMLGPVLFNSPIREQAEMTLVKSVSNIRMGKVSLERDRSLIKVISNCRNGTEQRGCNQ